MDGKTPKGLGREGSPSRPSFGGFGEPALPKAGDANSKGNRRPDDWRGCPFSGLGSRPSGTWFGPSGSGAGSGNLPSVIDSAIFSGGGWQLQVAGGGFYPFSPQCSPQCSPPLSPRLFPSANRQPLSKGNRRPDDWRGCTYSGLGSRPSGAWFGYSGSGAGSGNLPSIQSSVINSALHSSHPLTANRQNLLGFLVFLKYAPPCPALLPPRFALALRG